MAKKGIFKIGEFANFSRTTTEALRHYDRIDLLKPTLIDDNKYRCYSPSQLALVNVIRTFQKLGLSLDEIKVLIDNMEPDNLYATFDIRMEKIDEEINELNQTRHLLTTIYRNFNEGLSVDEGSLSIKQMNEKPIILGDANDYSDGQDDFDALNAFYQNIHDKYPKLNLNYPVWGFFSRDRIVKGDWKWPCRFYIYHPNGEQTRPEGLYAVGYTRGGYGECDELYGRLLDFIEKEGYEVIGGSYEEYIHNELIVHDESQYLIRLLIQVAGKC